MEAFTDPKVKNFNPRSREGSDFITVVDWNFADLFQSTLLRGERPTRLPGPCAR